MATKKQQREERALEKTVRQVESVAAGIKAQEKRKQKQSKPQDTETAEKLREMGLDPVAAGAEGYSVICPDCGQLVPSEYDSFTSQEAADQYAREHCDCHDTQANTGSEGIMPPDQLAAILLLPEPDTRIRVPEPPPPPKVGVCRYCGQAQSVSGCKDEAEAEEQATRRCRCPSAVSYQDKLEAQRRREEALREAAENIDDLFGTGAGSRGDEAVGEDALSILKVGAQLVYDQKVVNQQLSLTYSIKSKISRNSKGVLSIERKDTTTSKMEV